MAMPLAETHQNHSSFRGALRAQGYLLGAIFVTVFPLLPFVMPAQAGIPFGFRAKEENAPFL